MGTEQIDIGRIVDRVARWYAARCWWADLDDLKQEAWVAILEAQRTYDPARGTEGAYVQKAAWYRLKNYLWSQSAPVTGRKNHGETLRGLFRSSLDAVYSHAAPDPQAVESAEQWWAEMTTAVQQIVCNGRDGEVAARVLLAREKPARIAESLGWPVHKVWHASSQARQRIKNDIDLRHAMVGGAQIA